MAYLIGQIPVQKDRSHPIVGDGGEKPCIDGHIITDVVVSRGLLPPFAITRSSTHNIIMINATTTPTTTTTDASYSPAQMTA